MARSPEEMMASMIVNLKANTGKTLEEWQKLAQASKLAKHGEIVSFLKATHGLGHGFANLVARETLKPKGQEFSGTDLETALFAGAKAPLRPVYDALVHAVKRFGPDVVISPKKTYTSLRRNKQFALLQPSTASRLDVGLNLKGTKPGARLEPSGSFNAMVSHRVRLTRKEEIDKELLGWLKAAYDAS